jgi:S-formylglutathione hydrolase
MREEPEETKSDFEDGDDLKVVDTVKHELTGNTSPASDDPQSLFDTILQLFGVFKLFQEDEETWLEAFKAVSKSLISLGGLIRAFETYETQKHLDSENQTNPKQPSKPSNQSTQKKPLQSPHQAAKSEGKMRVLQRWASHGGFVTKYAHTSACTGTEMKFSVFLPLGVGERVPAIYWLSGLTCNEDNFITKAGAQSFAMEQSVALICPDTSPRGAGVVGEDQDWDLGTGAGFYVDATEEPWKKNYQMFSYLKELVQVAEEELPLVPGVRSIMGHSMGGHGALIMMLKNPDMFVSCSAFAPICAPASCPWGQKAFSAYLGDDRSKWLDYDASELVLKFQGHRRIPNFLIDQGTHDQFLADGQLQPEKFLRNAGIAQVPVQYNLRLNYDHSYFFISTFIGEHISYHAEMLKEFVRMITLEEEKELQAPAGYVQ